MRPVPSFSSFCLRCPFVGEEVPCEIEYFWRFNEISFDRYLNLFSYFTISSHGRLQTVLKDRLIAFWGMNPLLTPISMLKLQGNFRTEVAHELRATVYNVPKFFLYVYYEYNTCPPILRCIWLWDGIFTTKKMIKQTIKQLQYVVGIFIAQQKMSVYSKSEYNRRPQYKHTYLIFSQFPEVPKLCFCWILVHSITCLKQKMSVYSKS